MFFENQENNFFKKFYENDGYNLKQIIHKCLFSI